MANFIMGLISLTIGVVVLASVFISQIKATNTSDGTCWYANGTSYSCAWSTGEIALFGLLTLAGIAGMLYGVLNVFGLS